MYFRNSEKRLNIIFAFRKCDCTPTSYVGEIDLEKEVFRPLLHITFTWTELEQIAGYMKFKFKERENEKSI